MRDTAPKKAGGASKGTTVLVVFLLLASVLALTDVGARFERGIRAAVSAWWTLVTESRGAGRLDGSNSAFDRDAAGRGLADKPDNAPTHAAPRAGSDPERRADSPRSSKLHVNGSKAYYAVTGTSARALWRDIQRRAPRDDAELAVGLTSTSTRLEKTYERSPGGPCRMQRVDVYVDTEVTLPRWDVPSGAPAGLRRRWRDFADAVARHERTHERIGVRAGRRLRRSLDGMQAPSCDALRRKARQRANEILQQAEAQNRRFDERSPPARADFLLP
jgi:predicted secreted Zn-dependent protease